jgi:hypothetical protein
VSRTAVVASKHAPVADRGVRVGVVGPLYALVVVVPLLADRAAAAWPGGTKSRRGKAGRRQRPGRQRREAPPLRK